MPPQALAALPRPRGEAAHSSPCSARPGPALNVSRNLDQEKPRAWVREVCGLFRGRLGACPVLPHPCSQSGAPGAEALLGRAHVLANVGH